MCLATLFQGLTVYVKDDTLFVACSILARMIDGVGDSFVQTAVFSIISITFPDQKEKYIGWAESTIGFGLMSGPVIGSVIYTYSGYRNTFFFFSGLMVLTICLILVQVPSSLNRNSKRKKSKGLDFLECNAKESLNSSEDNEACFDSHLSTSLQDDYSPQISYWMFLNNSRSIFALLSCSMVVIFIDFYSSILSIHLLTTSTFNLSPGYTGLVFAVPSICYCITTPLVNRISHRFRSKRILMLFALCVTVVALLIAGPSEILGLPNELWVLTIGLGLIGTSSGLAFVPVFPEIMEGVMERNGLLEETDELCDKVSGMYGTFYSIGSILAPIVGGALGDRFGFRSTCDIVALATLIFCVLFFVFNAREDFKPRKPETS